MAVEDNPVTSEGIWFDLQNGHSHSLYVMLEPWAVGYELSPGETYTIHAIPNGKVPLIVFWKEADRNGVSIFCGDALYHKDEEIIDLRDTKYA